VILGLIAGLAAGAFWGLTFVAPAAVAPYTEIDLALIRYLLFGLTSLALMALGARFRPRGLSVRQAMIALYLGLTGYVVYYVFVAYAVRLSGPAIAPLVIGALPVILAIIGNWQEPAAPWRKLVLPLGLIAAGLVVINAATLQAATDQARRGDVLLGTALAFGALAVWVGYAVVNAREMRKAGAPGVLPWTGLQGIGAMVGVLPLLVLAPAMGWSEVATRGFAGDDGQRLLIWGLLTGVLGSWIAQLFWTIASKRLPLALSAQLIVSETVFALLYGFLWAARWPTAPEWLGMLLLMVGVMFAVRVFSPTRAH
jgi:drug/metabolite transporter (DMT)-like permease